ncbi:hypothetical protein HC248_00206 [Polaromonas vacuolata]|uniref:Translocator protein BipB-like C-terminal domain-containing protein n=1 Tax=Polaromonas vacuolata TaxID=37448 RepID=A0A6H2H563_9BURK|nr:type III secretion system translocon subunit SctE [Polaromonas vacuolata]QJC54943.1 hypothetical protein HC248_00206 [Polaromonas vacuolata]
MRTDPTSPQQPPRQSNQEYGSSTAGTASTAAGSLSDYPNNAQPSTVDPKASGIPWLPDATNFSPEDFAIALGAMQNLSTDAQLSCAQTRVKVSQKKMQDINKKCMQKIADWSKNSANAEKKGEWMGILGVCIKALAVVATVAAVVMTGGLAAPLMFVAVVGMVGAGISLASDISKLSGGKGFELTTLVFDALGNLGLSYRDRQIVTGAIGLPLMIADPAFFGMFVTGIAGHITADKSKLAIVMTTFTVVAGLAMAVSVARAASSGAAKAAAEVASETGKTVAKTALSPTVVAALVQRCTALLSGVLGIPTAVITGLKAVDTKNADKALIDKTELDNFSIKIEKILMDGQEDMKKLYSDLMDQFQAVSSIINENSKSISQTAKNIAPNTV